MEIMHLQCFCPDMLVQVHEHILLQARFPEVDRNAVVMPVQAVNERLD